MKKGMMMCYDNMLRKQNTALRFGSIQKGDTVQKLVASTPEDYTLGVSEIHTLEDVRWNDNHERPIT